MESPHTPKPDFRDRAVIKKLEFIIGRFNASDMPLVLYNGRDYSRMTDAIHMNIKREDIVIMPMAMSGNYYPFIVVAKDFVSGWDKLCETLQRNIFLIAKQLRETKKVSLNIDALARSLNNRYKVEIEKEAGVSLPDLVFVTEGDKK